MINKKAYSNPKEEREKQFIIENNLSSILENENLSGENKLNLVNQYINKMKRKRLILRSYKIQNYADLLKEDNWPSYLHLKKLNLLKVKEFSLYKNPFNSYMENAYRVDDVFIMDSLSCIFIENPRLKLAKDCKEVFEDALNKKNDNELEKIKFILNDVYLMNKNNQKELTDLINTILFNNRKDKDNTLKIVNLFNCTFDDVISSFLYYTYKGSFFPASNPSIELQNERINKELPEYISFFNNILAKDILKGFEEFAIRYKNLTNYNEHYKEKLNYYKIIAEKESIKESVEINVVEKKKNNRI